MMLPPQLKDRRTNGSENLRASARGHHLFDCLRQRQVRQQALYRRLALGEGPVASDEASNVTGSILLVAGQFTE